MGDFILCLFCILLIFTFISTCSASPVPNRNEWIIHYFNQGYTYGEICEFLTNCHAAALSLRQLKRILRSLRLKRKNIQESPLEQILFAILTELSSSGKCLGFKTMWRRLQKTYCLNVKRSTVMLALRVVDPEGVAIRKKKRLLRRNYVNPGPNFLWHIDGYDKLKPFGFAIHGAIDGFSRKILWLKVASSNNNPQVIANYFLDTVGKFNIVPTLLRADRGTENVTVGLLQMYFRQHEGSNSYLKSFIQGKSTSNQRIESWWSQMRRLGADWWICYFKDLRDQGLFNDGDPLHTECLRFCYGPTLQYELETIKSEWNQHKIRRQINSEVPAGKPDMLFYIPEKYNSMNYGKNVCVENVETCRRLYTIENELHNPLFNTLVEMLIPGTSYPKNVEAAFSLYKQLITLFDEYD